MKKSIDHFNKRMFAFVDSNYRKAKLHPYSPNILAGLGFLLYFILAANFTLSLRSILDEGLYLLKGYYFVIGKYVPFQDYGVLTNHMPLSFVIPGLVQKWFGPGLQVGRVYSLAAGTLMLVGIWITAYRLKGKWWATFAVWAIALNVSLVKIYSVAFSQVLVALILSWILVFAVGQKTTWWQAAISGALAGILVMTRINMAPVAVILLIYFFFQYGAKSAAIALVAVAAVVITVHAIYWPGILRMWAYWIPEGWITQLESFYPPWEKVTSFTASPFKVWIADLDDVTWNPIISFWDGLRFNFIAIFGVMANILLWPSRERWGLEYNFRVALFLNTLFLVLLGVHMWASLSGASCHIFCYSGYVGFFNLVGVLAVVATMPFWQIKSTPPRVFASFVIIVLVFTGVGFGSSDSTGKWFAEIQIPRLLSLTASDTNPPLWGIMQNKFGIEYRYSRQLLPAAAGFFLAVFFVGFTAIWQWFSTKKAIISLPNILLRSVLVAGFVLSPTALLGGGDRNLDCGGDVVAGYENAARQLKDVVPSGASVYYNASNSPILLLYLEDVKIYPPQLNNVFSFSNLSAPEVSDELLRYGLWNQLLLEKWKSEAEVVLVEGRHYVDWENEVEAGQFSIALVTEPIELCRGKDSQLIVLSRN